MQLYFAHGVQLGVIDVLYNNISQGTSLYCYEEFISSESVSSPDQDILDEEAFIYIFKKTKKLIKNPSIESLINKILKIISVFRKSPTKNDIFQRCVHLNSGKEISY
ncbi:hypothetical protein DMUE_2339 [Dictyocoela muelleri]|nr:hypothetical protein DMUE_2339 [Dictyocoela muelleri]